MGLLSALTGFFTRPAKEPPVTEPAGSDGVVAYGGIVTSGERHRDLQGRNKWVRYDDVLANTITVAGMARIWGALHRGAKWTVEANKRGGKRAERAADLVRGGLIEAPMATPWSAVVAKAGTGATFRGSSLHEQVLRRRSDGRWVTDYLDDRPMHTIERWDKPSEQEPWRGAWQQTASGATFYLQRERLLYVVDNLLGNDPAGVGVLRHVTKSAELVERLEQLELWGYELDLRGIPVGWAPIRDLVNQATRLYSCQENDPRVQPYVRAQLAFLDRILEKHVKDPELSVLLDSSTYVSGDEKKTPSNVRKWDLTTLKAEATGHAEARAAINAKNREIARLLGMEWMLMGDGEGARAVHDGKTTMTGMVVNGSLEAVGAAATHGPARRLVRLNGFDEDTCTPRVYPEPVPTETVDAVCKALAALAQAGAPLRPQDLEIVNVVLDRMHLPKMAEAEEPPPPAPGTPPVPGTPPDPAKGEVDVNLEDPPAAPAVKRKPGLAIDARVRATVNHMDGMKGQAGAVKVARSGTPPYYGIRFDDQARFPGTHLWLAEDELEPLEAEGGAEDAGETDETDDTMEGM